MEAVARFINQINFEGSLQSLFTTLATWHERARQRDELARLDPYLLKDIGVSAVDAQREAGKPFWRP